MYSIIWNSMGPLLVFILTFGTIFILVTSSLICIFANIWNIAVPVKSFLKMLQCVYIIVIFSSHPSNVTSDKNRLGFVTCVLENEWDGNKKIPLLLNNFICFPLPMKEKICHLILRIGKKVRNKRKRKWCPFQNHSFEFMIFNGGNLVWKYLKSWAKCQDKQLYVFLSRKG